MLRGAPTGAQIRFDTSGSNRESWKKPGRWMFGVEDFGFAGGGLDRHAHLRPEAPGLRGSSKAKSLPVWRGRPLVAGEGPGLHLALVPPVNDLLAEHGRESVFLGIDRGAPLFAEDVSQWNAESAAPPDPGPGRVGQDEPVQGVRGLPQGARFADLRALMTRLSPLDAEIAGTARSLLEWHRTHRFCPACGAPSEVAEGGWLRICLGCGRRHFPRTDPVVIMLVTHGNSLLIGRSPGWPENFYSLLAGFMEPGETVVGAVRREVAEEAGIAIGEVRLLSTQPWPFPASLMIGCHARALGRALTLDPAELEDATWINREDALAIFAGTHPRIGAPRRGAIAHFLMKLWLADRVD